MDTEDLAGGLPELLQDASAVWRCDDGWSAVDLLLAPLTSLEAVLDALRGLGTDDLIGLLTVNCEFSLLVRLTGTTTRVFLTSPEWAVAEYALGRAVAERCGPPAQGAIYLGDADLLADWGVPATDLVETIPEIDADLPDTMRGALGVTHLWR